MACEVSCLIGSEDSMSCMEIDSVDLNGKVRGGQNGNLDLYNVKPMSSNLEKSRIAVGRKSRRPAEKKSKITVIKSDCELATNLGYSRDLKMMSLLDATARKIGTYIDREGNQRGIKVEAGCSLDEERVIEVLSLSNESRSEAMASGYEVGDLVWGKVGTLPWWPGQIFNAAASSSYVRRTKQGCLFVSFFGDGTYNFLHPKNLLPFECHFHLKSNGSKSKAFKEAVQDAINEVNWREELAFTCRCRTPSIRYEEGAVYPTDQVVKSRREFKPEEIVLFLHKVALEPMNLARDGYCLRSVARILAYRKAVFAEKDPTYDEVFESDDGNSGWASNDRGKALAQGAAGANFSQRAAFPAQKGKRKGASSSHSQPHKARGGTKRARVEKAVDGPKVSKTDYGKASVDHDSKNSYKWLRRREDEAKFVDKEARISKPSKSSASIVPLENALAKSDPPLESRNKEKELASPKGAEADLTEPGAILLIKFPTQAKLPSTAELKSRFARVGSLDVSATHTCWNSYASQVSFKRASDAEAARDHFLRNGNVYGSTKVSCYLQDLEVTPTPKLPESPKLLGKALTKVLQHSSLSNGEGANGSREGGGNTLLTSAVNQQEARIEKSQQTILPSAPLPLVPFYPKVYSRRTLSQFANSMNKNPLQSCQTITTTASSITTVSIIGDIFHPMLTLLEEIDECFEDFQTKTEGQIVTT